MKPRVVEKLLEINGRFYHEFALPFAETRTQSPPGFRLLLAHLPVESNRVLDIGCGEGRFGRFLKERSRVAFYSGVDFSEELLAMARTEDLGQFTVRDLSKENCLTDLGIFDAVVCLAALQHIPGRERRLRLLVEMVEHLAEDGRIFLSTWQFLNNPRQRKKIVSWAAADLTEDDVEENDFLISWERGGWGFRYVSMIDEDEIKKLAREAGLMIEHQFRSDGKEGDLNLYVILERVFDENSS